MKKLFILLLSAGFLFACNSAPDSDKAEATDQDSAATASAGNNTYTVDTTESKVEWTGYKPGGEHNGTFNISSGTISGDTSGITAGNFTINVAGIANKDLSGDDKAKLESHLKSADFFEIEKYPTAKFEITKVEPYDSSKVKSKLEGATHLVSGNLTLRDQTKNVTFPAKIDMDGDKLKANANFNIDRTQWGMNYKGPNNPQNFFISKEVNIKLDIVARKQ